MQEISSSLMPVFICQGLFLETSGLAGAALLASLPQKGVKQFEKKMAVACLIE